MPLMFVGTIASNNQAGRSSAWISNVSNQVAHNYGVAFNPVTNQAIAVGASNSNGQGAMRGHNSANGTTAFNFLTNFSGITSPRFNKAAVDASGNIFVCGFDPGGGTWLGILAKYNSSGTLQWSRTVSQASNSINLTGITVSANGNIIVSGSRQDGGFILVLAYDTNGTLLWQKTNTNGPSYFLRACDSVTTDSSNAIYLASEIQANGGGSSRYAGLIKLDSAGNLAWQKVFFQSGNPGRAHGVAVDTSGNIYFGGRSYTGAWGAFVAKVDSTGSTLAWQKHIGTGGSSTTYDHGLYIDNTNNVYLTSYGSAGAIVKFNTSGTLDWQRSLTSSLSSQTNWTDIVRGGDNSFYMTMTDNAGGGFKGTIAKLPENGTKTGSYNTGAATYTYAASGYGISDTSRVMANADGAITNASVTSANMSASSGGTAPTTVAITL
jgi:hypothetical protein